MSLPTFEKGGGGAQVARPVSEISEWINLSENGDTGVRAFQTPLNGFKSRVRELGDTCPS